jgi:hypothetical protein
MLHEWIVAIAASLSALVAIGSFVISIFALRGQEKLGTQQQKLETEIATKHRDLEEKLAKQQQDFQERLAKTDLLYSQRAQLLPLWEYMSGLNHIDIEKPSGPAILKIVNALELVALCCESNIVDPDLVRRTFRQTYIDLYEEVTQVREVPGRKISGLKLLGENKVAMSWYDKFKQELKDEGKVKPLSGS